MLIYFAKLSSKSVENASSVFGVMNTIPTKPNVLRSSAQTDTFLTISEDVLESAIFANLTMPEEFV